MFYNQVAPRNNERIQITPKMKFFVTESQQVPGEIVDYTTVSRDGATIDFSSGPGLGKLYARVVQSSNGRFDVTYYESFDWDKVTAFVAALGLILELVNLYGTEIWEELNFAVYLIWFFWFFWFFLIWFYLHPSSVQNYIERLGSKGLTNNFLIL